MIIDKDKCRMMEACRCQSSTAVLYCRRLLKATNLSDSDSPRQNAPLPVIFPAPDSALARISPPENCVCD